MHKINTYELNMIPSLKLLLLLLTLAQSTISNNTFHTINQPQCRSSDGFASVDKFYKVSCAQCYAYIFPDYELKVYGGWLIHMGDFKQFLLTGNSTDLNFDTNDTKGQNGGHFEIDNEIRIFEADAEDLNSPVLDYLRNDREKMDWQECCKAARRCCDSMVQQTLSMINLTITQETIKTCPAVWDGWQCWPETKANQQIAKQCPIYILAGTVPLSQDARVTKTCESNGSWYQVYDPITNRFKEWSNYTTCLKIDHFYRRQYVRIAAYIVSIVSILPALVIFSVYRQLRCTRVLLHKNLLIALMLKGITVIIFDSMFTSTKYNLYGYAKFSPVLCNYLAVMNKYLLVATYCWMFNEGFYLHNILINALKIKDSLKMYYIFGWGFPLIPLVIYVSLKKSQEILSCWVMAASIMDWVINSVCIFILLMNVIFLIRIIAIIVSKLKTDIQQEHIWHRQTLKAVLLLAPLFGVQILLTLYRPQLSNGFLEVYHILNSLIEGLQGFFVALIFCYFNGEVINKIKATKRKSQSQSIAMYGRHDNYANLSKFPENSPLY